MSPEAGKRTGAVRRIARKEVVEMWRDGRLPWAAVTVAALLAASAAAGWRDYAGRARGHERVEQAERERWLNQGEKSPHSAAHHGVYVFRPAPLLSAFDRGVNDFVGETAFLEADRPALFLYKPAEDSPPVRRFGGLTAAVTLQVMAPLLIVLLTYATFAGEREQGTLRQALAQGVRARDLALGKVLGTVAPLFLLVAPSTVAGVAALVLSAPSGGARPFARAALLAAGYLLYFGVVVGICLTVSARASSSRQALVVLLALWFLNCLMSPPVAADLADRVAPAPSSLEFANDLNEYDGGFHTFYRRMAEVEGRLLEQYGVASADALPVNPKGVALLEIEEEKTRAHERHFDHLQRVYAKQGLIHQAGALPAPALAVQSLSMALAGTDTAHHFHFARAAEQYRREMVRLMNEDDAANRPPDAVPHLPNMRGRETWAKVPAFTYEPPPLSHVLRGQLAGVLILSGWFVAAMLLTLRSLSSLKV